MSKGQTTLRLSLLLLLVVLLLALWTPGITMAVEVPQSHQGTAHWEDNVPHEEGDPESNLPFLFAVYTIAWIGFFAYLFVVSQRQRDMRREIEALRRALEEREKAEEARRPQERE